MICTMKCVISLMSPVWEQFNIQYSISKVEQIILDISLILIFIMDIKIEKDKNIYDLSYIYTLRLIGSISYFGECDLMVHTQKHR